MVTSENYFSCPLTNALKIRKIKAYNKDYEIVMDICSNLKHFTKINICAN